MSGADKQQRLRRLPGVDRVLEALGDRDLPRAALLWAARATLQEARLRLLRGEDWEPDPQQLVREAERRARRLSRPSLRRVVNATGTVLHTNLGRAPLAPQARRALQEASGYCNLEMDLERAERGSRQEHVEELLRLLTGAEAALVVNNNAAAVLLCLHTLAQGREVVVSRGELVEIGGSFRMPEVMACGGAVLREVGTTNRTYLEDYRRAIGPQTALLLKVHTSNYRLQGFVHQVPLGELVELGRQVGVPVMEDLGSGALLDLSPWGLEEPTVQGALRAGVDLVTFSGDKLLGGPQAGIILGRRELLERVRRNPLHRALRVGKLTLAALEATLRLYLEEEPHRLVPVLRAILTPPEEVRRRAERLAEMLRGSGLELEVRPERSAVGGGSLPGQELPSWAVCLRHPGLSAQELARRLRAAEPPVLGRVRDERLVLDLRGVEDAELSLIAGALRDIMTGGC